MAMISRNLLSVRPQELGKIKIGFLGKEITSRDGKKFQPPKKLDHFIITTRQRGEDGNFIRDEVIHAHPEVGPRPTSLGGVLMYERPEENFHSEMAHYRGRANKFSTCTGEEITFLGTGRVEPCRKARGLDCPCKPYSRLILQLWAAPFTMGYHVFRSTSWESTNNIQTALEDIYNRMGTCLGAPVRLVLYTSEDRHDGKISYSQKVGLVLALSLEEAARAMAGQRQLAAIATGGSPMRQLAAGVQADLEARDAEEAEVIAAEFFPEVDEEEARSIEVEAALMAEAEELASQATRGAYGPDPREEDDRGAPASEAAPRTDEGASSAPPDPDGNEAGAGDRFPGARDLNARYFAILSARGMASYADRRAFQGRLLRQGLISAASCSEWAKLDYLSAIAEAEKIPLPGAAVPGDDDTLFRD